jgi:predicted small lipoprotein YifL
VIIRSGAEQAAADQRNWQRAAAHPITSCLYVDVVSASVVACGRFRPQVELCAIGLNLPPDGENAKPDQGEQ